MTIKVTYGANPGMVSMRFPDREPVTLRDPTVAMAFINDLIDAYRKAWPNE